MNKTKTIQLFKYPVIISRITLQYIFDEDKWRAKKKANTIKKWHIKVLNQVNCKNLKKVLVCKRNSDRTVVDTWVINDIKLFKKNTNIYTWL